MQDGILLSGGERDFDGLRKALAEMSPGDVLAEVERAGLRGRGGAAFPTARKWQIAAGQDAPEKHVIANGGEHEPGSRKDLHLVERRLDAVLEGTLLCVYATGASVAWLYLLAEMRDAIRAAESRIAELAKEGLCGNDILGSGFSCELRVHGAPTTYVAGEETAAIDSIEGGLGKPRGKPPYPGAEGLFGRPTTVQNVETLAHVPAIVREGADWYRGFGTEASPGTMLFTLGDEVTNPGVYELPFGSTYRELIYGCGGGPRSGRAIRALLPAYSCAFLRAEHLDTPIDHETLAAAGSSPGCGGVTFVEEGQDLVARVAEIARFFEVAECGQCPPCRLVTSQLALITKGVLAGKRGDFEGQTAKLAAFGEGRGRCALIPMALAPVRSAMRLFREDFEAKAAST